MNKELEKTLQMQIIAEIKRLGNCINKTLVSISKQLNNVLPTEIHQHFEYTCREINDYFLSMITLFERKNQALYLYNEASNFVRSTFESVVHSAHIINKENYHSYFLRCVERFNGFQKIKNELENLSKNARDTYLTSHISILDVLNVRELNHRKKYVDEAQKFKSPDEHKELSKIKDIPLDNKCKNLGERWELYYISVFRPLSQTIHGDVHNKGGINLINCGTKEKIIYQYKSISVVSLWNAVVELFLDSICAQHSLKDLLNDFFEKKKTYEDRMDKLINRSEINMQRGA